MRRRNKDIPEVIKEKIEKLKKEMEKAKDKERLKRRIEYLMKTTTYSEYIGKDLDEKYVKIVAVNQLIDNLSTRIQNVYNMLLRVNELCVGLAYACETMREYIEVVEKAMKNKPSRLIEEEMKRLKEQFR